MCVRNKPKAKRPTAKIVVPVGAVLQNVVLHDCLVELHGPGAVVSGCTFFHDPVTPAIHAMTRLSTRVKLRHP